MNTSFITLASQILDSVNLTPLCWAHRRLCPCHGLCHCPSEIALPKHQMLLSNPSSYLPALSLCCFHSVCSLPARNAQFLETRVISCSIFISVGLHLRGERRGEGGLRLWLQLGLVLRPGREGRGREGVSCVRGPTEELARNNGEQRLDTLPLRPSAWPWPSGNSSRKWLRFQIWEEETCKQ